MADISKIKLPDNSEYNVKDTEARTLLQGKQGAPLMGQTFDSSDTGYVTPSQVALAIAVNGRDAIITSWDEDFGLLYFSSWNVAETLGIVVSNTIAEQNGVVGIITLTGLINYNTWMLSTHVLQNALEFDSEPTEYSSNPVVSNGIYNALQSKLDATATSKRTAGILYGQVDSTSTATAFTATISGVTEYYDGLTIMLKNGVVTSASGFTININGLGAKASYSNLAAATADTTIFNVNYTMMFVYDSTRVAGGGWICYRGYDANTNTIGYQLRTNSSTRPASDKFYRYRVLFTSADGTKWVPANTSTSTNATASRAVNQRPIDPFGDIVYYGTTTAIEANATVTAAQIWQEYTMTFGYSFNRTGAALVLTYPAPIYIKCAPQADGSAIIDADTPYVQALPSTADGKIYIYLGRAYSATAVEMVMVHPVYYHDGTGIRLWTGATALPAVSASDNGKFLRVVNGAWTAESIPSAESEAY